MDLLRPHQVAPVSQLIEILAQHQAAVDLSDTGTGKTYVAAAVANRLALPTLIVCPKIAQTAWQRAAEHFSDTFSVIGYEKLRTGRTPLGHWDHTPPVGMEREETFVCQCCQCVVDFEAYRPCYCQPAGIHCIVSKKKAWNYGKFNFHSGVRLAIFDEVHRCSGIDSLNSRMLYASKRQGIKIIGLSATAACTPLQLDALGYALDMHAGGGAFYSWARRYGCRRDPVFKGFHWFAPKDEQTERMQRIHAQIIPARGVRVRCADIPGFPQRDVTAELFDLDGGEGGIDKLYAEMQSALDELAGKRSHDVNSEHPLTALLRARQKVEILKVPLFIDLASDYLAKGYSVVVFVNFRQTIEELSARLHCDAIIDGSPAGVRRRDYFINAFQVNSIRLLLVNSEAGGIAVSLQDLDGEHPRVGLVSPMFSATTLRQVLGRLHREGGKSIAHYRVVLASKTVEVNIKRNLDRKLSNLDALLDGDLCPA